MAILLTITPEMRKSVMEGQPLFQQKKGSLTVNPNGKNIIKLFQTADASTIIHETGHQFLENLREWSTHPEAPESLKKDFQTIKDWLGIKDTIEVSQHEKFARGWERYLKTGEAPSSALGDIFQQFKEWLTQIYHAVAGMQVPLKADVKEVFDRLLATDNEIANKDNVVSDMAKDKQALYRNGFAAGVPQDEFNKGNEAIYGDNKPEEVDVSEHLSQLEQSVEQSPDFKEITDPEHDTILGELNQLMQQPQITYDQKFELKKLKRDVLLNLQKRQTVFKDIDNLGGIGEANHYLRDMLRKIESSQLQSAKRSIGALQNQIRKLGLSKTVRDGTLDREIIAGFYKLSGQKPTIEPSEAAMKLAEIMRAPPDYYRVRLNNNGSNIGKAEDYIAHTEHDRHKMRNFYWYFKSPQKAFNMWAS
jgi:hypothetical protein